MSETRGIPGAETLRLRTNGVELHAVADGPLVVLLHRGAPGAAAADAGPGWPSGVDRIGTKCQT